VRLTKKKARPTRRAVLDLVFRDLAALDDVCSRFPFVTLPLCGCFQCALGRALPRIVLSGKFDVGSFLTAPDPNRGPTDDPIAQLSRAAYFLSSDFEWPDAEYPTVLLGMVVATVLAEDVCLSWRPM
jgi:hypothetical protein